MNYREQTPDLTECDREPIHQIGAVQPFGGLLALTSDWLVARRSTNCAELLSLDELPAIGTPLGQLFYPSAVTQLREALARIGSNNEVERLFGVRLNSGGPLVDCAIHCSGELFVIEFEPHAADEYREHVSMIAPAVARLEPIKDIQALFDEAVTVVKSMLGYDRVMLYRFHHDLSGEVVAEAREENLEPFFGLRYPATDIPAQARELFKRNRFRVIADIEDEAAPIEPELGIDGKPLDLSLSVLRASSPVHLHYLANMGVKASMTIAIIRNDKLWGLFACHHYAPKCPPFSLRTVAEMFSQMFSLMLDRLLIDRSEKLRGEGRKLHDQLMMRLAGDTSLATHLPMIEQMLVDLVPHDGISIYFEGDYRSEGDAPDEEQFLALIPPMSGSPTSALVASDALADRIPQAKPFADRAAGALVVPVSRSPRDYLVLWRKPLTQKVRWAGNPAKAVEPGESRLMPRSSFAEWGETVEGRSERWSDDELVIAEGLRVTLLEIMLRMTDEVARERKRAQEQQELLIAELNHRVRNILNLIRSLVAQSQDDAMNISEFAKIIGGRIGALASAHDNITRENWSPAPLSTLFESEIAAYIGEKKERFALDGDEVLIKPDAYTVLALVIHELVTNSAKYGSLCDNSGRLDVGVNVNKAGDLEIKWRETGGPPVKPPKRRGFGSTIIERSIPFELKGDADLRFKLSGLEGDFLVPSRYIERIERAVTPEDNEDGSESMIAGTNGKTEREGLPEHVLVVEDSMIIALDTEDNLKELGVKSVAVEGTVQGALKAIADREPDFALVDFNLGAESSVPVAEALKKRGIRFALATGYSELSENLDELGAVALVRKPYGIEEIEALLRPKEPGGSTAEGGEEPSADQASA